MSNTTRNRITTTLRLRTRAAVTVAGVCASAVLATTGVATAAQGADNGASHASGASRTSAASVLFDSSHTADELARMTRGQAEHQQHAAEKAEAAREAKRKAEQERREARERAEAARRALARSWVTPVDHYTLTASFAQSGSRWVASHSGQDFAVPTGTPVHAVHGGTVVKAGGWGAGDGPAYGNALVIAHPDGTYTQYAHLSRVDVSVGQQVGTGDQVALSGNTGNSTGPHLHFEVRTTPDYGSAIDPMQFLYSKHVRV